MPLGEDARRALKTAVERQKATREATQKVASDIAAEREEAQRQTTQPEVEQ